MITGLIQRQTPVDREERDITTSDFLKQVDFETIAVLESPGLHKYNELDIIPDIVVFLLMLGELHPHFLEIILALSTDETEVLNIIHFLSLFLPQLTERVDDEGLDDVDDQDIH